MGFEPTTFCLGSKHSTAELRPLEVSILCPPLGAVKESWLSAHPFWNQASLTEPESDTQTFPLSPRPLVSLPLSEIR